MKAARRNKFGFTLIELLVVIAIIAVLAAILFPVFVAAKDRARETVCGGDAQQIGKGLMLYIQDWSDKYPDVTSLPYKITRDMNSGYYGFPCQDYNGVSARIRKYCRSQGVALCPADPYKRTFSPKLVVQTWALGGIPANKSITSYIYRLALAFYSVQGPAGWYPGSNMNLSHGLSTSEICRPTKTVVFHEWAAWHHGNYMAWQIASGIKGQPYIMAVYADGHAKLWKEAFLTSDGRPGSGPDDWPYDANWFSMSLRGPLGGSHQYDPRFYWDM